MERPMPIEPEPPATIDWGMAWSGTQLEQHRIDLYRARLARTREFMRRADMPALVILDPNNIFYATGARNMQLFAMRTPARYLLLLAAGPAILYEYAGCEHLARDLPTIDLIRPSLGLSRVSSGGHQQQACASFATEIARAVRDVDPSIRRLGVDRFPLAATDALRRQGFELADADEAFAPARSVKLPLELPYMREALRRVDEATARLQAGIRPGRSESAIWAEFWAGFMQREGQYICTRLFESGPRTYPYFQECSDRPVQDGELLCLDTDALGYEGYAVDYSRTFLCGERQPSPEQRELHAIALEQLTRNAANLRPGMALREFAELAWSIPERFRKTQYGTLGHGIGMAGGEFPNIPHHVPGQPYPLDVCIEPGMVICLESYIGSEASGQGVKLEDQYVIHASHVERMSTYPFDERLLG